MNHKRAHGGAKMRFAEQYHPLQEFRLGRLDKAFRKRVQFGLHAGRTTGVTPTRATAFCAACSTSSWIETRVPRKDPILLE